MDGQKKQKMMLGVLVVLAAGMGTWYVAFRDTGDNAPKGMKHGVAVRKKRVRPEKAKTKRHVRRKKTAVAERVAPQRKVRERKAPTSHRRKKRRGGRKQIKKQKYAPMG